MLRSFDRISQKLGLSVTAFDCQPKAVVDMFFFTISAQITKLGVCPLKCSELQGTQHNEAAFDCQAKASQQQLLTGFDYHCSASHTSSSPHGQRSGDNMFASHSRLTPNTFF